MFHKLALITSLFGIILFNCTACTFAKDPVYIRSLKLNEAINLIDQTEIGRSLKPEVNELLIQNKLQLTGLADGHYGESGEGCVIKEGQYYYEGFFVSLNNKLSVEELASALVHEVTHYQMIKERVAFNTKPQRKVMFFETSAFAVQYQFIEQLEQLKLVSRQTMFIDEAQIVSAIMQHAYDYITTASQQSYNIIFKQLVDYGYSAEELTRFVSQRPEKECKGFV